MPTATSGVEAEALPERSPSPPLHTPDRSSLHRRQSSARKQAGERFGSTSAAPVTPSPALPSSPPAHPHISRTPLLASTQPSSSFSTLPYYRPPTISSPTSPYNTARTLTTSIRGEEVKEEVGCDGHRSAVSEAVFTSSSVSPAAGMKSVGAGEADPSFRAFVSSHQYASYESEVVNNVDLLRRSNALNEDTADYVLILQPDHVRLRPIALNAMHRCPCSH